MPHTHTHTDMTKKKHFGSLINYWSEEIEQEFIMSFC